MESDDYRNFLAENVKSPWHSLWTIGHWQFFFLPLYRTYEYTWQGQFATLFRTDNRRIACAEALIYKDQSIPGCSINACALSLSLSLSVRHSFNYSKVLRRRSSRNSLIFPTISYNPRILTWFLWNHSPLPFIYYRCARFFLSLESLERHIEIDTKWRFL